jgi:glutamate carboxypeptidase
MDSAITKDLLSYLQDHQMLMVQQLSRFCEINSGSDNLAGLSVMLTTLQEAFLPLADEVQIRHFNPITTMNIQGEQSLKQCGDALFIRKRPELSRRVLLVGHMDTVYAQDHAFQSLTYIDKNTLNGPGVTDMKGGLVVMAHALAAFEYINRTSPLGWDVVINGDEEIGSLASRNLYEEIAPNYKAALVYEPAMDAEGALAKNRKGSGKLTLIATGKTAHAGKAFYQGRNAICYLAEAVTAIHKLNELQQGVTINIGRIAGGEALNVVPDKAVAQMDIRIQQAEDEVWVRKEIKRIIDQFKRKDYSLNLYGSFDRPVKRVSQATERLFLRLKHLGKHLGLNLDWRDSGGCCDGNNLSLHGLAVLDTLGVRGGNIHNINEYILLDSLIERAALSALLLQDLAKGGLEELHS